MSEAGDYDPGAWRSHDFKEERKEYDRHVGRSYSEAVREKKESKNLILKSLSTNSESPLVIACDVTGSMGDWPATIFSKLPYLDLEGKEYLGQTMEISFAAVGDVYCDRYPIQVRPFCSGLDLKKELKELVIEGGGGSGINESYDLCALYYAKNTSMPKAKNPIFIMIGDEALYDMVDVDTASKANVSLEKRVTTKTVFDELKQKFSVYLIRKPYNVSSGNAMSSIDQTIYSQWEKLLGGDHISILPGADRVVDVIFGILAKETERIKYFHEEIKGRQRPEQVSTVLEALKDIHKNVKPEATTLNPDVKVVKKKAKKTPAKK